MTRQNPGLADATGHAEFITSDALSDDQVVEVTTIANNLDTVVRSDIASDIGELPLPPQGTTYVFSFNGATGHVQGVSSFNGATGAVVYVVDGGEI